MAAKKEVKEVEEVEEVEEVAPKKKMVTLQATRFFKNGMIGDGETWKKDEIKQVTPEIARQLRQDDATAFEIVSK